MFKTILIHLPAGSYRLGLFGDQLQAERFARAMLAPGSSYSIIPS